MWVPVYYYLYSIIKLLGSQFAGQMSMSHLSLNLPIVVIVYWNIKRKISAKCRMM